MSSPLSDAFRNAAINRVEGIKDESKNKIVIAMRRTEERVADEIQEIILRYGLNYYYDGYTPRVYMRTGNLFNSGAIKPWINEFIGGGRIGFQYGAEFDAELMDHSTLTLWPGRTRKRDGCSYTYENNDVDEKKILDNFRAGIHPNTGVNQGAIWLQGMIGTAPDELRRWKNSGAIQNIFKEELRKLL